MTEHKKIPLPGEGGKDEGQESSLFERASGAFGLDGFGAAPMPKKLDERPLKRAKKVERKTTAIAEPTEASVEPATDVEAQLPVPAAAAPAPVVVEGAPLAPRLEGTRHTVDRAHLCQQGLIDPDGDVSELLEEFRIVKRQILRAARDKGTAKSRRVLISSPHPDEGKTFCAANLAIALAAERDMEVVLVDADIAKPSVLSTFGLPKASGFMDALSKPDIPVEDLVLGTDIANLWILPAGHVDNHGAEYVASEATADVLDRLTVGVPNRIVIFDTPPALAASPAAELAKHVGQVVVVARADQTGRNALEDTCQLLAACDDIKLLLNAANFSPSGRRFGSYYE
ncbi:capsular polysaccharide biosynthesis protein [Erythrobacter litoralis]|uniref:Possible capsular polysaccharide biosynthesis protein n=1 Tax=Erythrobacter litoralis (strain HTCC2594) TaxID=314225 RepID=Q2NA29_ERYLH|nr:capsular polysaccharide biosynthesis protein [Erythrobacter litoralis]ABC63462.1 possible capsular polysaccharide biosynthesis protein [Erythrobacter litoralis HTCC2594]